MPSLLLRGGTVLMHDGDDHVQSAKKDILIVDNIIKKVGSDISYPDDTEVIDCTNNIISPGFIDSHHHVWQTQLKGRHANEMLLDYIYTGHLQASNYTPVDIFWGQLGGCLEALSAGTTTVVDHAHMIYSSEHARNALSATVSSGIRSIFCYTPTNIVTSWDPLTISPSHIDDSFLSTFRDLAQNGPYANGRVRIGLGFDGWFLPKETVMSLFDLARELGIEFVTTHYSRGPITGKQSLPRLLSSYGLLDSRLLISHGAAMDTEDAALIKESGAHVSSTPSTELQMGMGQPVAFREDLDIQGCCSLGIDCQSITASSIPSEMRLILQSARGTYSQRFVNQGKTPRAVYKTVEDVFNLGTIQGARALRMEDTIGSIAEGKLADLVIFNGLSPAMIGAAQHDPLAAIVLHSSPADVDFVIVDGIVRKKAGVLEPVELDEDTMNVVGELKRGMRWEEVAEKLLKSREALQRKIEKLDFEQARKSVVTQFSIDEADLI